MAVYPTLAVEIAFDSDPDDDPQIWTNVTAYVIDGATARGRQAELDKVQAGTAVLTLGNADRRFDPTYTAGPYWDAVAGETKVLPMRQLRIVATYDGDAYPIFHGFVDEWDQRYAPPADATVVVTATDAFKVLAAADLPPSVYAAEILADEPVAWWRFSESADEDEARDEISGFTLTKNGTPTLGAAGLVTRDDSGSAQLNASTDGFQKRLTPIDGGADSTPIAGGPLTVEFIYKNNGGTGVFAFDCGQTDDSASPTGFEVQVDAFNDRLLFAVISVIPGSFASVLSSGGTPTDGDPHHIACVWQAGGTLKIYIDGIDRTASVVSATNAAFRTGGQVAFGSTTTVAYGTVNIEPCFVDEYALYDHGLSAARVLAHSDARKVGGQWAGDTTGERIGRILDAVEWPAADRDLDDGESTLQSADLGGGALAAAQKVEETEAGILYVKGDGTVRFRGRHSPFLPPHSEIQATFGDGAGELNYSGLTYKLGENLIYNDVAVARVDGTIQRASDATSRRKFKRRTLTRSGLLHQGDSTSRSLAYYLLGRYKRPVLRITQMVVDPSSGDGVALYPVVLSLDLGDRTRVLRRPQDLGSAIDQETAIEGVRHDFAERSWLTTYSLSPADTRGVWVIGTSRVGVDTIVGF